MRLKVGLFVTLCGGFGLVKKHKSSLEERVRTSPTKFYGREKVRTDITKGNISGAAGNNLIMATNLINIINKNQV